MAEMTDIPAQAPPQTTADDAPKMMQGGMSLQEFIERTERGERFEIIDGEIITEDEPMKYWHNDIAHNVRDALNDYVRAENLGKVYNEMTFVLPNALSGNWLRGSRRPDVMFIQQERITQYKQQYPSWRDSPLALVPDLVVEVVSADDLYVDVTQKVQRYLRDGVKLVWIVDPPLQQIVAHTPDNNVQTTYKADDTLTGGDVLPGFSVQVSAMLPQSG